MLSVGFLQYGCTTMTYLPSLGNARSFTASECDLVYEDHHPLEKAVLEQRVEMLKSLRQTLKDNPSLADKVLPSTGTIDSLGKNAIPLGSAATAIAGAFTDMAPSVMMANIIASISGETLGKITEARSEDKNQERLGICMPRKARNLVLIHGDDLLVINDKEGQSAKDLILEAKELKNAKTKTPGRNEGQAKEVDTKVDGTGEGKGPNQP
jgi:hypothetical protein